MTLGLQDRRDIEFLVHDVLDVDKLFKLPLFQEQSWETFDLIMDAAAKFAHEQVLPTNPTGDREGVKFENGEVKTPAIFKALYKQWREGGWIALTEPEERGGSGLPWSLTLHPLSALVGANVAFFIMPGLGHGAAEMIEFAGTAEQKKLFVPKLYSGEWAGTMCLTEPNAGSDVGASRTTAVKQPDGTWHIKGQKTFISWGEQDLTKNIVYPVLARVEGDPPGTPGLSLFLVNKYQTDAKGNLGARNGVVCSGIEHKMGIHCSPTCTLEFGEDAPAVGELLGEQRSGMKVMFKMMNTARIAVGVQAMAIAEAASRYAHQYALDRIQGSAVENLKNPAAERVAIVRHPDVRRMLMDMRGTVEGLRALMGYAAYQADLAKALTGPDAETADEFGALLTPLCKGYASEIAFDCVSTSITVLGGHGFLCDHPLEQYLRDSVIARLYEGTTGIQAMDLVGRKLGRKGGLYMMELLGRMDKTINDARGSGLNALADRVMVMRNKLGESAMGLGMAGMSGDMHGPLLFATPFMFLMGDAVLSWLHLMMATAAVRAPEQSTFHKNKVITARHFIVNAEGRVRARASVIAGNDRAALEMNFEEA